MLDNRIRLSADIEVQLERVAIVQVGVGAPREKSRVAGYRGFCHLFPMTRDL